MTELTAERREEVLALWFKCRGGRYASGAIAGTEETLARLVAALDAQHATRARAEVEAMREELKRLRDACAEENENICQVLGKALRYPWFKDDPVNFPAATEADGVCVGEHVAISLADEAVTEITRLRETLEAAEIGLGNLAAYCDKLRTSAISPSELVQSKAALYAVRSALRREEGQ